MTDKIRIIETLGLSPHPEGGYFKEIYRSDTSIPQSALPQKYSGGRVFYTSIYYLLGSGEFSSFHRLRSDEIWHYYDGSPMLIHSISENCEYNIIKLGRDLKNNELPQYLLKAGCIFAAEVKENDSFTLIGCTVSPGFEYDDFELLDRSSLISLFPQHREIIIKLTR